MSVIAVGCARQTASGCASGVEPPAHGAYSARMRCRRRLIEGAAALLVGALTAIGSELVGTLDERRVRLEREWVALAPALAEHAKLERAEQSARAAEREAQLRMQPYLALLALLDVLSLEADAGVSVSRLQLNNDDIELQLNASDSSTAAAWVERLSVIPGAKAAQIDDLKLIAAPQGGQTQWPVEAVVRFRLRDAQPPSPRRATVRGERARAARASARSGG